MSDSSKPDKPQPAGKIDRQKLARYFFFAVFLVLLYQLALMLSPFAVAILGACILSVVFYPFHRRLSNRLKEYPSWAAGLSTTLIVLLIVIPMSLAAWLFIKETSKVHMAAEAWIEQVRSLHAQSHAPPFADSVHSLLDKSRDFLDFWNIDPEDIFLKNVNELSANMTHVTTALIRDVVFLAFDLVVLTFVLFFFLRDGPSILRRLVDLIPMPPAHKQAILARLQETLLAVLRGILAVAVAQGALAGIGFALFGIPFPVLLGVLTTLLSPIPVVGAAGVWGSVAVCLTAAGELRTALFVALWNLVIVNAIDHFLRPILIGSRAKIPVLLLFFGLVGGMRVYGFKGLLLGPLVIALVLAFINIYRQEFQGALDSSKGPSGL